MAYNIIADFFNLINTSLFDTASVLLIMGYIIWEIPRSVKVISEEYTKDVYPVTGRVVDIFLFVLGLFGILFLILDNNVSHIIAFLKTPGITSFFLVVMVFIPLIILLGFFKRFFARMDAHLSVTVFLVHAFLDLMHTLFFIALSIILLPEVGYLLFGPK